MLRSGRKPKQMLLLKIFRSYRQAFWLIVLLCLAQRGSG